ncbi:MAG: helix-turn-helix transcriptional regulator [Ruminococcus sp.]|nr:helix-turn-helix transcriptional regulator [Ruminococcus sp.]
MQTIDYSLIGKKIKNKRVKLGLTQEKLAEKCDISVSYVAHIERGTKSLSLETAVKISNVLDVSLDYLLINEINDSGRIIKALESELDRCTPKQIERFIKISRLLLSNIDEI